MIRAMFEGIQDIARICNGYHSNQQTRSKCVHHIISFFPQWWARILANPLTRAVSTIYRICWATTSPFFSYYVVRYAFAQIACVGTSDASDLCVLTFIVDTTQHTCTCNASIVSVTRCKPSLPLCLTGLCAPLRRA